MSSIYIRLIGLARVRPDATKAIFLRQSQTHTSDSSHPATHVINGVLSAPTCVRSKAKPREVGM